MSRPTVQNCWEFFKCGRQPGGPHAAEHGPCPAATRERFHGVNRGVNGGRLCWAVTGTLCREGVARPLGSGAATCMDCRFFLLVRHEEGDAFVLFPAESPAQEAEAGAETT